jgi:hypothetical protein
MKRVEIIVEGVSEQIFVNEVLVPYIQEQVGYEHLVEPLLIHSGQGGFVNYEHLRNDVQNLLCSRDPDLLVTTFVDFFRIPQSHMPGRETWKDEKNHYRQAQLMEEAMAQDISDRRFTPYIQMHEFEALIFSSIKGFEKYWSQKEVQKIQLIKDEFSNPEDINTSPTGAPSKRILAIKPDYEKPIDGNAIAIEIGIQVMLNECPKFKQWVEKLIERMRQ